MNVYLPNLRLPSEYQEVEYIESDGNQYINSLYYPNYNTEVYVKFAHNESVIDTPIFGCRANGSNTFVLWSHPSEYTASKTQCAFNGTTKTNITGYTVGTVIEFQYSRTGGYYKDTTWTWSPSSGGPGYPMIIFGLHNGNSTGIDGRHFSGKMWSFQIKESGTLVRDFVPCYRVSDNVIGLYDLVNNQFYTNSGSGTFSKGNDVTMAELKNAYIGEYPQLQQIFDFSTSDLHGFTYRTTGGNGLTIDTTNRYCTDNNPGYGCYYKQVNYKKCRQRIKGKLTGGGSLMCGVGNDYAPSSGFSCSLGFDNSKFFVGIKGMSSYSTISSPSGFNGAEWHYYDTIWDNGSVTVKVLNLDESVVVSNTYTATETTQKYIGFCGGTYPNRAMYISEYRLAYEE